MALQPHHCLHVWETLLLPGIGRPGLASSSSSPIGVLIRSRKHSRALKLAETSRVGSTLASYGRLAVTHHWGQAQKQTRPRNWTRFFGIVLQDATFSVLSCPVAQSHLC